MATLTAAWWNFAEPDLTNWLHRARFWTFLIFISVLAPDPCTFASVSSNFVLCPNKVYTLDRHHISELMLFLLGLKSISLAMTVTAEPRGTADSVSDWLRCSCWKRFVQECVWGFRLRVCEHASVQRRICLWGVLGLECERKLLYVPLGGVHFKAVGSMVLPLPRLVSLAFQSSIRSYRQKIHLSWLHYCRAM